MSSLHDLIWHNGRFLGIEWSVWKGIGLMGNAVFFSRFIIQWYASEKTGRVVVPVVFWWLSLVGTLLLLTYAVRQHDSVFILAYAFAWIPYMRNLVIHHRHEKAHLACAECGTKIPPQSNFCAHCGAKQPATALAA
ncbi:MAG TPA: lipid-A-disaccharide synthase N-terminal domain-containing protein [Candidatus Acidoferrum sp.]|jgi:lipid-A-disaccharide synthase-like uncharacterized protein|nr:lipid-A-disaccharide synthase N-terminal domain-containing protein [Candidatus Acidoferrum sp.]